MNVEKNIRLLSWLNFFSDFVFFAPVAIIYFAKVTGSMTLGMSIFSVAYVSSALFEVPTGVLSDFIGRTKTTMLGAICGALCIALYAIGGSYAMLFLGAILQGLSRSFYSGNNDALLHDTLKQMKKSHEYHVHLGRTSSWFQVALAIASVTGSIMAARSFALVMWISVIPQICAFIVSLRLVEPSIKIAGETNIYVHIKESFTQFKQNIKLRYLTIASVIRFSVGESGFFLRATFINSLWPLWAVGIANMLSHIGGALSYYFSGKIIKRFNFLKVLNYEIISNRVINFIALLVPTTISPVLMSASSLTFGVGSVATNALSQKEFTQEQRATMGSLSSLMGSIAFGFFAIVLGAIADKYGVIKALLIAQFILLIPLLYYKKVFNYELQKNNSGLLQEK